MGELGGDEQMAAEEYASGLRDGRAEAEPLILGVVEGCFRQRIAFLKQSGSHADRKRLAEAELLLGLVRRALAARAAIAQPSRED